MIPLWLANPGEDFQIDRTPPGVTLLTANGRDMDLAALEGCILPVTAKTADALCAVFHGHRIFFDKGYARSIRGRVLGRTKDPVEILPAQPCTHRCASCGGCIH